MVAEGPEFSVLVGCLESRNDFLDDGVEDRDLVRAHFLEPVEEQLTNVEVNADPKNWNHLKSRK